MLPLLRGGWGGINAEESIPRLPLVAFPWNPPIRDESVGMDEVSSIYQQVGEERLRALVAAFYRRVREDELIGSMYPPDDWQGAEKRLGDFLIGRFGGPPIYIQERGHPRLRMRHVGFSIGVAERDRWLELMSQAMHEVQIPAETAPVLESFFLQVADFMRNREEGA